MKKPKQKIALLLSFAGIIFLSGCATCVVGFSEEDRAKVIYDDLTPLSPVYTRSHFDLWMMYFPIYAFTSCPRSGDGVYAPAFAVTLGPFMVFTGAVDLPLSFTIDTLILPWEINNIPPPQDNKKEINHKKANKLIDEKKIGRHLYLTCFAYYRRHEKWPQNSTQLEELVKNNRITYGGNRITLKDFQNIDLKTMQNGNLDLSFIVHYDGNDEKIHVQLPPPELQKQKK